MRFARPSSSRSPPRSSGSTGRSSASTTSPASSPPPSRCSRRSASGRAGSRSAPASSTCATRTRSTWPRLPRRADLLADGRLQLGVSRGSPEPAWHGAEAFGYSVDHDQAREKTALFRAAIAGAGVVPADAGGRPGNAMLPVQPQSPGLADRIWWGSGSRETAVWAGEQGMNLMSSTLLLEDTQVPFDQLQAEQIELFRAAWTTAGHTRQPRVSVSRSVIPITSDLDRRLFGTDTNDDQVGWLDGAISRFGRGYTGEPDQIADDLAKDAAVQAADTVLLTVPSQLGVDYNAAMLETIVREIAPALGWSPKNLPDPVR